jgi:hypothetical protein
VNFLYHSKERERESRVQSAEQDRHKKHIQGKERKGVKIKKLEFEKGVLLETL